MDWAFGKSAFVLPSPCQDRVQPPDCCEILSAALPATRICAELFTGKAPLFFSRTSDLRTASRAKARCAGEPITSMRLSNGRAGPNKDGRAACRKGGGQT